jgi:hypothetical protein
MSIIFPEIKTLTPDHHECHGGQAELARADHPQVEEVDSDGDL